MGFKFNPFTGTLDSVIPAGAASPIDTETVQDIAGGMFSGNTETLITATYQDVDGTIDLVVDDDLSNYDNTTSGFQTSGQVDTKITTHAGEADPHPGYALESSLATVATSGAYADLTGKPTLGTAADNAETDFATAAQGSLADSATQPGDNISTLTNDSGYLTEVDINGQTSATVVGADEVLIYDVSATALRKVTAQDIADLGGGGGLTQEEVEDIAGAMFTGNTETLITATYQDADGTIDLVVDNDLANYDNTNSAFFNASSDVDHDATTNFVADEHIAHSGVTLTAGSGLSGGGTIAASRTFNVDINSETNVTAAATDEIMIADASDSNAIKKVTAQSVADLASLSAEYAYAASEGDSSSTSDTPANKVTLSANVISGNTYRVDWYAEHNNSSVSGSAELFCIVNGTERGYSLIEPNDSDNYYNFSGFYEYTAEATESQDFKIDYAQVLSGTTTVRRARISIYRIA